MSEPWMPDAFEITMAWAGATGFPRDPLDTVTMANPEAIRALIREAVEKALAEQREEWIAALKAASGEYRCHPDFAEMWAKAEADPIYWAELLRSSMDAYHKQDARHASEAARAGCWYCKNGNVATFETDDAARSGWYHHFDDETPSETCRRGEIHDLLAALDAKADAGPTEER